MRFDVSVQNFPIMNMLDSEAHLGEVVEELIFCHGVAVPVLVLLVALLNHLVHVTAVSEVHHYAQLALLRFVDFSEAADIRMV